MSNDKIPNPFRHLKRKRLPGMHLITACEGGAPLDNSLAAFFFLMLHRRVEHNCLTKEILGPTEQHPEDWALEEWSYISDQDAFPFLLLARAATEQVQRWIAEGSHAPYQIPTLGGEVVIRPEWAVKYFGTPDSNSSRKDSREFVKQLLLGLETEQ